MFCPQCGTKTMTAKQRFCRECGAEIGTEPGQEEQRASGASAPRPPHQCPFMVTRVIEKDNVMKTLLTAGGLLLALPLVAGILLASLVAGVALLAVAIKLAPLLLLGIVIYWVATRRQRRLQTGR